MLARGVFGAELVGSGPEGRTCRGPPTRLVRERLTARQPLGCGTADEMTLLAIRLICEPLEIRVELQSRSRGADLDRLVNARHSALHESVARALSRDFPTWEMAHEVSFSISG